MTVYRPSDRRAYLYDFVFRGHRYKGNTAQTRREDALLVEARLKVRLRQEAGGIAPFDPIHTHRFQDWAQVYLEYQRRYTDRPDLIHRALLVVLEFWGAKPRRPRPKPAVARVSTVPPPYHDLRLGDPIADARWLRQFEAWIRARGVSGSTRNTYLSVLSGMYRVAMQPEYRAESGITTNPFIGIRRSLQGGRTVALEADVIVQWVQEASYHVALAATIAALAPKLRLGSILALTWAEHVDLERRTITVARHKTSRRTGAPQVTPISDQLLEVLQDARLRAPHATHVITWRGRPVDSIKTGAKRAAVAIGLTWGLRGVTFHTLRHSIATLLAQMGISERIRMELMGHAEIQTTQKYTHLAARAQVAPHEALSAQLPIARTLIGKPRAKLIAMKTTRRRFA